MNIGNKELELEFERAVEYLCDHVPAGLDRRKPMLMHVLRVGMRLFNENYGREAIIGGLLHDTLEWTDVTEEDLRERFGEQVLAVVKANTKDRSIEDGHERRVDYVKRCAEAGIDALVVKAADALDSHAYYSAIGDEKELARSIDIAKLVAEHLTDDANQPIFDDIRRVAT